MSRTRQAAGLGRPRLRVVLPPDLPAALAIDTAARLQFAAAAAGAEVVWVETWLDADCSLIRQRRADAGLGWLSPASGAWPESLEVMALGEFEPEVWIPSSHPAARGGPIGLAELAHVDVMYGPRRARAGTYDAWLAVLRAENARFEFTDPPFRHSLPMTLTLAAIRRRATAVLTGPRQRLGTGPGPARPGRRHRHLRHGSRPRRTPPAGRHGGPAVVRGPATPTAAGSLRHRRRHDAAGFRQPDISCR